jgi:23S rRNA (adenine2030-N6)-methyltransferase
MKHFVLCRVLTHLRQKPAAFRMIDTHAGAGQYDLGSAESQKTGEWRDGIGRLLESSIENSVRELLAPYLEAVSAANARGTLTKYPGSPALALSLLRAQDRLIACELEPQAASALANCLRGDARAKAITIDGWTALGAYVPPKERRGLVLIDPPFEKPGEFSRLAQGLAAAHRKWPTGIYLLWYPIKESAEVAAFTRKLAQFGIANMLRLELTIHSNPTGTGLRGSGLIAVNPPWTLFEDCKVVLGELSRVLAQTGQGVWRADWLAPPA